MAFDFRREEVRIRVLDLLKQCDVKDLPSDDKRLSAGDVIRTKEQSIEACHRSAHIRDLKGKIHTQSGYHGWSERYGSYDVTYPEIHEDGAIGCTVIRINPFVEFERVRENRRSIEDFVDFVMGMSG